AAAGAVLELRPGGCLRVVPVVCSLRIPEGIVNERLYPEPARFEVVAPVAYGGKEGCENIMCRRQIIPKDDGTVEWGPCIGWHCSYCDEPTSYQGHNCDAAKTLIEAAQSMHNEGR